MRQPGQIDWQFKRALAEAGLSQRELGRLVGINHTLLSMYARGRYVLNMTERQRIADVLQKPEAEVFCA